MVKLLLFRAISLVGLIALLIWEIFFYGGYIQSDMRQPYVLMEENVFEDESIIQTERKHTMAEYCRSRKANNIFPKGTSNFSVPSDSFRNIIVSDKHNLLYCYIPKVACSNWKRVLMVLNGDIADPYQVNTADVHNRSLGYFRYLNEYSPNEIVFRLNTYYKFLFVRHPYERLVSAYRNKFIDSYNYTLFKQLYGRAIIRYFRHNPDKRALKTGEGVSFEEFVNYLLASDSEYSDRHWKQYDRLCHPCLIYYDYIGKFENLKTDANELLQTLEVDNVVQFPHNLTSGYKSPSSVLAKEYFKQLPRVFKTKLKELYKHDLSMFGYSTQEFDR